MPLKPTLAIADDDALQSELLAAWLEQHGYDVLRFDSGDSLVSWASDTPSYVDAFLLDIDMPGRDGFQSCIDLKSIAIYSGTPAVFVSSVCPETVTERVSAAGGSWMVRKDADLLPRLTSWLQDNLRRPVPA
ncbi:MAG TPA: response regulator [Longimicrobiaceae bacterium]|nr:response regulator [Longimicrobiaceae bacterium]